MQTRTRLCSASGHPEFTLTYDDTKVIDPDVKFLVGTLESMVTGGSVLTPGQTFQVGWMTTRVTARDDTTLGLSEPDMASMPVVWVESVTHTLGFLRLQRQALGLRSRP